MECMDQLDRVPKDKLVPGTPFLCSFGAAWQVMNRFIQLETEMVFGRTFLDESELLYPITTSKGHSIVMRVQLSIALDCFNQSNNERSQLHGLHGLHGLHTNEFTSTFARAHESWVRELSLRLPVLRALFFHTPVCALGFVDPILLPRSHAGSNQSSPAFL